MSNNLKLINMEPGTTNRKEWDSSLIKWTEYTSETESLYVVFSNELAYTYDGVTQEEYQKFCEAESKGSYFSKHFRKGKTFKKIETNESADTQN